MVLLAHPTSVYEGLCQEEGEGTPYLDPDPDRKLSPRGRVYGQHRGCRGRHGSQLPGPGEHSHLWGAEGRRPGNNDPAQVLGGQPQSPREAMARRKLPRWTRAEGLVILPKAGLGVWHLPRWEGLGRAAQSEPLELLPQEPMMGDRQPAPRSWSREAVMVQRADW